MEFNNLVTVTATCELCKHVTPPFPPFKEKDNFFFLEKEREQTATKHKNQVGCLNSSRDPIIHIHAYSSTQTSKKKKKEGLKLAKE